ncbi:MAG: hypothetical protein IT245_07695, partial [Bacteroidia bacterium]|nr:hypothetical protein [Bacteroidia bacterium]
LKYASVYVFILGITAVFIVNPVDLEYASSYLNKPYEAFELSLDEIYQSEESDKVQVPQKELRNQKTVLAFLSASCPHCKIAAEKIAVMKRLNPALPFYFFINGDDKDIIKFLNKTETNDIPHSRLNGSLFIKTAGLNLPVIYYYNKGKVELQVDYYTLEQKHLETWLQETQ